MSKSTVIVAIFMLLVGLAVGYGLSTFHSPAEPIVQESSTPLFYRNPMDPTITSPIPTKDSMGMDYIPVYADSGQQEVVGTVEIDPVVVQNIGVRTAQAKLESMSRLVRTAGRVDFNEESMIHLHPKVDGWIEEIWVDKTGQAVEHNQMLLRIYSPKLVSAQQEYLLALNNLAALETSPFKEVRSGAINLVKSSRERLTLLDVPEHQILELEQTREIKKSLHIHSPVKGTAIRIGARQGQFVTPQTELYMIVDLNTVWVYADVYEYELPWVKIGDQVEMTLAAVPGKTFMGAVSYIYPYADSSTRTTKVRMVFDNQAQLLRPDMFADIKIQSDVEKDAIVIPSEAVVRSGSRTQVFVVRATGKYEPRIVQLGVESEGRVSVLSGVDVGEQVVTSAQFLLDSESKLREATAKMLETMNAEQNPTPNEEEGSSAGAHNHD